MIILGIIEAQTSYLKVLFSLIVIFHLRLSEIALVRFSKSCRIETQIAFIGMNTDHHPVANLCTD
jgi:hypothetical protein